MAITKLLKQHENEISAMRLVSFWEGHLIALDKLEQGYTKKETREEAQDQRDHWEAVLDHIQKGTTHDTG